MAFTSEEINRLLDLRVRDAANRQGATSIQDHLQRVRDDRPKLLRRLGLEPFPAGSEMNVQIKGTIFRSGYRIEKIAYESRPNFPVSTHLYLPEGSGPFPIILRPHGHWPGKKSEPIVQASAIGLALSGYAVLVVDSPGEWGEPPELNERAKLGSHDDPWLSMGTPLEGFYVWDLMRGIDYLAGRNDIAIEKLGIAGASSGGMAAMYAFAVDERIQCAALVCYGSSLELQPHNGCLCNHVPGITDLGDRSDVLALRAPAPLLLVGASEDPEFPPHAMHKTRDKLAALYKRLDRLHLPRLEIVEGPHDFNRRMRESVLAFFDEHLRNKERRQHRAEPRPITDGLHNPFASETAPADSPELLVFPEGIQEVQTMRNVLELALSRPGSSEFAAASRLLPWAKYDRIQRTLPSPILSLNDQELKLGEIDQRSCIYLGLSVCEAYAQILHIMLPGGIEGWEQATLGPTGDVVSSLIGSMKALVGASASPGVEEVRAVGPASSMIARFFQIYRPRVKIAVTHEMESWQEVYRSGEPALIQPIAVYLEWPFPRRISAPEEA